MLVMPDPNPALTLTLALTMFVMPERRLASTHFSSWPMTLALHTAVIT